MEVGDATAIFFTSPAWAALLGRAVLRERLGLFDCAAIALALVGVTLVARPAFVFGGGAGESRGVAPAIALCGSTFHAGVFIVMRKVARAGGAPPAQVAHAYAAFAVVASPALLLIPGQGIDGAAAVDGVGWACAVGVGGLATLNQLAFNAGAQLAPAGLSAMARTIDVPAAFGWQVALFGEAADTLSLAGAALIVGATVGTALRKLRCGAGAVSSCARPNGRRRRAWRGFWRRWRRRIFLASRARRDDSSSTATRAADVEIG